MPLDRQTATARLSRQMLAAEQSISTSLVETTALLHSAAMAHADVAGAPVVQSHAALLRLTKAVSGILSAQADAARAHGELLGIHRELAGPEEPTDCPEMDFLADSHRKQAA